MASSGVAFLHQPQTSSKQKILQIEQCLIGMLLNAPSLLDKIEDDISPDMFAEPAHEAIYLKIKSIVNDGKIADAAIIAYELSTHASVQNLGGSHYLMDLVEKAPPPNSIQQHAQAIARDWQFRGLEALTAEITILAQDRNQSAFEKISTEIARIELKGKKETGASADEGVDRVLAQYESDNQHTGVKTGLYGIDDAIGSMRPGELWIACGRPSMGKSAFALCVALNASENRQGTIVVNCEMTIEQMVRRNLCDLAFRTYGPAAPSYSAVRKKTLTKHQEDILYKTASIYRKNRALHLDFRPGITVEGLKSIVRRKILRWAREGVNPSLVVIDHVGLVRAAGKNQNRSADQGEIARALKEAAGSLNVAILALAQLNRQVESRDDKRPTLADMRDSGEFEENADGVIGFYRQAYYAEREPEPKGHDKRALWEEKRASRSVDAILLKVREGQCQTITLWADMGRNAIRNEAPQNAYGAPIDAQLIDDPFDLR